MLERQPTVQEAFETQIVSFDFASDLQMYTNLMKSLKDDDVLSDGFKNVFIRLYKLRRNERFRNAYFDLLQNYKKKCKDLDRTNVLRMIIEELQNATGNVELSFATKLMATADDSIPIWDSYVEAVIKQWHSRELLAANKQEGIDAAIAKFDLLESFYTELRETGEAQVYLEAFNRHFPNSDISDSKKMDYVLWVYGRQLIEGRKARKEN